MKSKIYIVGASGFGKEVAYLIEELEEYEIAGFVDDDANLMNTFINGHRVVGNLDFLKTRNESTSVVISIGNPNVREKIYNELKTNSVLSFPNIISKGVRIHNTITMGTGNIICSDNVLTTNISFGNQNHINLNSTIGHDVDIDNFATLYPGCNISGNVKLRNKVQIGTGSKVIQGVEIGESVILGAGSVVVKSLEDPGTYVGIPAKKINDK